MSIATTTATWAARLSEWRVWLRLPRRQSLVGRLLWLQLLWAAALYALMVTGLWWISGNLIENNLRIQAQQWVAELDAIGIPLFVSRDKRHLAQIEARVQHFPEIAFVRYYNADGTRLVGEYRVGHLPEPPAFDAALVAEVKAQAGADNPYVFDDRALSQSCVRLLYPVTVKSIRADGLIGYRPDHDAAESMKVIGYIDLGMDMAYYKDRLFKVLAVASSVIAFFMALLVMLGRHSVKKALQPLTSLQQPLARLAHGDVDVEVITLSGDAEIVAISDALNTTIAALRERDLVLRRMADYDPLTALVNRGYFLRILDDEIQRIEQRGGSSAVFFVDLDQFKYVNDTLGHASGDRLLVQVSQLFTARMRDGDVVGRFGGDEFLILARNIGRDGARDLAKALNNLMRGFHFVEDGQVFNVYCSIGVAMVDSGRAATNELIAQADIACHEAKRRGRNRYHLHELADKQEARMAADVSYSRLIKEALSGDTFKLHYQPIVSLNGGRERIYEVLLRLPGMDGEMISPTAFLPAAERFGLMGDIDQWVITHAMAELGRQRDAGADVVFSVNLSGQVFEDPNSFQVINETLARYNLSPNSIIFEITEQVAVRHLDRAREIMQSLMARGFRFALDDFGAGFSAFSYLKHLPVQFIKISQEFIESLANDVVDRAMVKSIVQVARALGRQTIAEYVQDARTIDLLREYGVDYAQGYFIGEPLAQLADAHSVAAAVDKGRNVVH